MSRWAALAVLFFPAVGWSAAPALPGYFVRNVGQLWSGADFALENASISAQFRPDQVSYRYAGDPGNAFTIHYLGGRAVHPVGDGPLEGQVNYLLGSDRKEWRENVPAFHSIAYREMWPGVDVVYSLQSGHLKSEFQVAPGADTDQIRWRADGASSIALGADGSLLIKSGARSLREAPPEVFEQDRLTGALRSVKGAFRILPDRSVGVTTGEYDHANRLIFDPVIGWSTYLGGTGQSSATAVAFDHAGNTVVAGYTSSLDLALGGRSLGSVQRTAAFVAKFNPAGNQLIFCTYLGGTLDSRAFALALDKWNNIYVAGTTSASNFPVVRPFQSHLSGDQDAFVAELNSAGQSLIFSTFLGGTGEEQAYGIGVDRFGNIYVGGDTSSTNFPLVKPIQRSSGGGMDGFVAKFSISGRALIWSSYLGGGADEHVAGLALDASGATVLTGSTQSSNFPAVRAAQPASGGNQDAFVTRVNSAGTAWSFSTYLGGSGGTSGLPEMSSGVAIDPTGAIYIAGTTSSDDFPVTAGAFQTTSSGGIMDAFAAKLNSAGGVLWCTYLGGSAADYGSAIAVDIGGNVYVAGYTASPDFPSLRAIQPAVIGSYDEFLTKLNNAGSALIYSTLLGGTQSESANAVAVDKLGTVALAGQTLSTDFPAVNAYQGFLAGAGSATIARLTGTWIPTTFSASAVWTMDSIQSGGVLQSVSSFGVPGVIPIVGDWTGTGHLNLGVFSNGTWYLDNDGDGNYGPADRSFTWGQAGDIPVVGDWDGSGKVKAGLFRQGTFLLDYSGHLSGVPTGKPDATFAFGIATDLPIVADWTGNGTTKVGVFRNGQWLLDYAGMHTINGIPHTFGQAGDLPVVGDWDSSGMVKGGVYRNGTFLLDYNGNWTSDPVGDVSLSFGSPSPYALMRY